MCRRGATGSFRGPMALGLSVVLLLVGCSSEDAGSPADSYLCRDQPVSVHALQEPVPATELSRTGVRAIATAEGTGTIALHRWNLAEETSTSIVLLRELRHPYSPDADGVEAVWTHEVAVFHRDADAGERPWSYLGSWECELRRDIAPLHPVRLRLTDGHAPGDRTVELMASACDKWPREDDRERVMRLVSVEETDTEVLVVAGMVPLPDGMVAPDLCTGTAEGTIAVELEQPLGERRLLDAAIYPQRVVSQ